jgi:hypothetical protein
MDEATVTSPPPELLYTTPPFTVETAAALLGVVGARARVVAAGTVDAVSADDAANSLLRDPSALVSEADALLADKAADETLVCVAPPALLAADETLLCADDRLLAADDRLLCTEAILFDAGEVVVVVAVAFVLVWRLARANRLVASGGFSEWTCSIALRSLLKTPCLNLGANWCRIEWMELSSTLSTSLWNRSQSAMASAGCCLGFAPQAVRTRALSTRASRGKIIVARR